MHIECDHCGAEILEGKALAFTYEDEVYYFCSKECMEAKEYVSPREGEPETSAP